MFKSLIREGKNFGLALERGGRFYFFGSRHATREALPQLFPQFRFCFLKQVHGRAVAAADPAQVTEADAHFTQSAGLALVVQSADCMPLLLSSANQICAIHAGWRGMAQNIIQASAEIFTESPALAAIGPHIRKESFAVGADVALMLTRSAPSSSLPLTQPAFSKEKLLFDLGALARLQLGACFGGSLKIEECLEDTMANPLFHSYRREREKAGRQYSFVAINS